MLLNYNDTLDAVFTLAHEMGHSMHTILSNAHQPFVYSAYTIFVAEVPSTLSEALFLEYMLAKATDERERIVLLQHAIDGIVGTFYTQVMFADFELQAHRLAERGRPVTAEGLGEIYMDLLQAYHGEALDYDDLSRATWARIPHFFSTPYYVYQDGGCSSLRGRLLRNAQKTVRRADALVHHHDQAAFLRARSRLFADDAGLQPERFRADRHRLVGDARRVFRAAKDIDDLDALRDVD